MSSFRRRIIVLAGMCCFASIVFAQSDAIRPNGNSPYSRFGLGDPVNQYFAAQAGMGGLTAAFNDYYHLNLQNPASLTQLQATAFEVGLYGKYANLQRGDASSDIWSGNLSYIALGFPLINPINKALDKNTDPFSLGMSVSIQPFSTVAYDIRATVDNGEELGSTDNTFKGKGGTYKIAWGNAARYKNLSVGVSLGYVFGKISRSRNVQFDSLELAYETDFLDEFSLSGFVWNAGLQYTKGFGKKNRNDVYDQRLTVGVYGNSTSGFNTNTSRLYQREIFYTNIDTIEYTIGEKNKGTLPAQFVGGVMYERLNKFRVGVEYGTTQWSAYENGADPQSFVDATRLAAGFEIIPEFDSYNKYFRRVRYRAGFSYYTDPREINSDQLSTFSVSIGAGFPIVRPRQQISFANVSIEAGRFGLVDQVNEQFVRMTFGITLNDNTWFFKRKFN